ncbi:MAG: NAD(P)/FAD-dependent oxidoreductase [Alphaproteobacteria bacterium]
MSSHPSMHDSLWHATASPAPKTAPLDGDRKVDVAIVGGGFTGCSAALHLAEKGVKTIVLEARDIGWGGSGRNAGLVNAGLWLDPDDVVKTIGAEYGERLMAELGKGPALVSEMIAKHGIKCDDVRKGVIKAGHSPAGMKHLEEHARQWTSRGANIEIIDRARIAALAGSEHYVGGIIDHRSYYIQPLSYARGLASAAVAAGATIHDNTRVAALAGANGGWTLKTARGTVTADKVIIATNAYSDDLWPGMKQEIIPVGCYAYATEPLGENVRKTILPGLHPIYDTQPAMVFTRYDRDHRLIVGSLGYLPPDNPERMRAWPHRTLRYLFPQLGEQKMSFKWAGTLGFTNDAIPRFHEPAPGVSMTLGYNGRGIAPGTYWGQMLAKRAMGMPASEFPLPVTPIKPARMRGLWAFFYESAFSAYRLKSLFK